MENERNLLFGVVAFQSGAVDADGLAETCAHWTAEPTQPLADLMVDRGLMTDERKTEILEAVELELAAYGGDPHATLEGTIDGRTLDVLGEVAVVGVAPPRGGPASPQPAAPPGGHVVLGQLSPGEAEARDRYTLTHLHARGGMGRVWLARDGALGRQIALKELRPDQSGNTVVCSRFLYEARITAQLEHPGIVPVYELGEGAAPYYTMRFVRGRTLSEAIRAYHKKRANGTADSVGLVELLQAFANVCHAVAYAHSRGIIHRDLKGQNVVLGDFGEVIVLDWGLAKRVGPDPAQLPRHGSAADAAVAAASPLDSEAVTAVTCAAPWSDRGATLVDDHDDAAGSRADHRASADGAGEGSGHRSDGVSGVKGGADASGRTTGKVPESGAGPEGTMRGQLLGTPAYMAPEQARARHDLVDQRTDIYGLGAILYEILTGRPPFVAPKTSEIIRQAINEPPTPPRQIVPEIAPGLEAVCLKALRKEKSERYQLASDLAQEVRRHLADEPVQAHAEPLIPRAWRWIRHNRTKVGVAAALLVATVIALGISTPMILGAKREAEVQGQQARQAVQLLSKNVEIAFDDQLDELQREMIQDTLTYLEKFTGRSAADPTVRLDQGWAHQQMGELALKLGRLNESETAYRKAIAVLEPLTGTAGVGRGAKQRLARSRALLADVLVRRGGDKALAAALYGQAAEAQTILADARKDPAATAEDIVRLGQTEKSQGDLLRLEGKLADARAAFTRAIAELERALTVDARHPEARNALALAVDARGLTLRDLGDTAAAEADYRRSVELSEQLVADFPTTPRHRAALATSCNYLGWIEKESGRLDDAEKHLRREVELTRRLAGDFPDRTEYRRMLARGLTDYGTVLQAQSRIAEAEPVIREAIDLDTKIATGSPDDVRVRHQLAIAHHDLGLVLMARGDAESAVASFDAARKINEALAAKWPDRPRYRAHLADNFDSLALALSALGRPGVDEAFRSAGAIYEALVAAYPDHADYRIHQATSMRNQGSVLADQRQPEAAESVLRRALTLLDSKDPRLASAECQRTRAGLLINLGQLQRPGSEDALRRAIAICEQLLSGAAGDRDDRVKLALAWNNLGDLVMRRGPLPEAGPHFAEAVSHFEKLVAAAPRSMEYQHFFGIVLDGQGEWLDRSGKMAEAKGVLTAAVDHQRQAVELSNHAADCRLALADHLIKLADVNRKLGAYDEAAKLALEVPRKVPSSARPRACLDAARALARLVARISGDPEVPRVERDHLMRVYLTRTVVLLRDAVDGNPRLSESIKADPDLKILESRPEFQAIMNTLVEARS